MAIRDTLWGSIKKPGAARMLKELLDGSEEITGRLIFGWPVGPNLPGEKGAFACDAVLVSDQGQVTAIDLGPAADQESRLDRQDGAYNLIKGQVSRERELTQGRNIKVYIQTITFDPEAGNTEPDELTYPVVNQEDLLRKLLEFQADPPEVLDGQQVYKAILMGS